MLSYQLSVKRPALMKKLVHKGLEKELFNRFMSEQMGKGRK